MKRSIFEIPCRFLKYQCNIVEIDNLNILKDCTLEIEVFADMYHYTPIIPKSIELAIASVYSYITIVFGKSNIMPK